MLRISWILGKWPLTSMDILQTTADEYASEAVQWHNAMADPTINAGLAMCGVILWPCTAYCPAVVCKNRLVV